VGVGFAGPVPSVYTLSLAPILAFLPATPDIPSCVPEDAPQTAQDAPGGAARKQDDSQVGRDWTPPRGHF